MIATLDDDYLAWLEEQVGPQGDNPRVTHKKLLKHLYSKEFVWIVPNDDNRCTDGIALRDEFLERYPLQVDDQEWLNLGCSVLEMIIGVARHLSFEAEGEASEWFWILLKNLKIDHVNDNFYNWAHERYVDEILDRLIFRRYDFDGTGGLFPLENPHDDQRKREIWYQMGAYILELE